MIAMPRSSSGRSRIGKDGAAGTFPAVQGASVVEIDDGTGIGAGAAEDRSAAIAHATEAVVAVDVQIS